MGAEQAGLIYYIDGQYIANPNTPQGLRLYREISDGKYYVKLPDGTSELFTASVTGVMQFRGGYDASTNLFPATGGSGAAGAIMQGDTWVITVGGNLGGEIVVVGDLVIAVVDTPGQVAGNWVSIENNIGYVPEDVANKAIDFTVVNDTLYPTTQAVSNLVSGLMSTETCRYEKVLTAAELAALDVTPVLLTKSELSLTAGQEAKFLQLSTEWKINPDGVAFAQTAPTNIILKTSTGGTAITHLPMSEVVGAAIELILQSNLLSASLGSANVIRVSPNAGFYFEASGGTLSGGGAAANITVVLYYQKITV